MMLASVVLFGLAALSAVNADCSFDVNADLPESKAPLFLQNNELLRPVPSGKTGVLSVSAGQSLTLACPGSKNKLTAAGESIADATCVSGTSVQVASASAELSSLQCSKAISSTVQVTDEACAEGYDGTILRIGFEINDSFKEMITVCHQLVEDNTLFVNHTIDGAHLDGAEVESKRPSFSRGDKALFDGYNPDNMYKQSNQKVVFPAALGQSMTDKLMDLSYIARGHLAPDADFLFGTWQWATYYFVNAAPQWQASNAGNWLAYEKLARKKASELKSDLNVITGTYGILELPNADGELTKLYLTGSKNKLPIPDSFWKIMQDPATGEAIAVVGSNNLLEETVKAPICESICEDNGWTTLTDYAKGYTYCCTVEALREAAPYVPEIKVSGILQGPK